MPLCKTLKAFNLCEPYQVQQLETRAFGFPHRLPHDLSGDHSVARDSAQVFARLGRQRGNIDVHGRLHHYSSNPRRCMTQHLSDRTYVLVQILQSTTARAQFCGDILPRFTRLSVVVFLLRACFAACSTQARPAVAVQVKTDVGNLNGSDVKRLMTVIPIYR
jgi:hypothetical protein